MGGFQTGNDMNIQSQDLLKLALEQQEKERAEQARAAEMQQGAIMANNMSVDTMAGMLVGQLLGGAIKRWMGGKNGNVESNGGAQNAGAAASAPEAAAARQRYDDSLLNPKNMQGDGLLKTLWPEKHNEQMSREMDTFLKTDPNTVHVTDNLATRFDKKDPYSGLLGNGLWR